MVTGLFDRSWSSYMSVELSVPPDINDPMAAEMLHVFEEYKEEIESVSSNFTD